MRIRCRAVRKRPLPLPFLVVAVALAAVLALSVPQAAVAEAPGGGYNYYFGNLHSHTSYSDGVLTPSDAFRHARYAAKMDFHAVTDHGYYMQEATNLHHWFLAHEEADQFYEPGRFVTLVGYEWTFTDGHMNGFDTPRAASRDTQRNLTAFFEFLSEHDGIGVFNHPNYDIQPNWNDFEYRGLGDKQVSLIEVGSGPYRHNVTNERAYRRALDRGWRVGAVSSQDNHRADWGTAAPTRTGLIAPELTREAVLSAMRDMRTYATEDSNVRVLFASGDSVMGDEIAITPDAVMSGKSVEFRVYVADPDEADRLETVQIVSNGGEVVWEDVPGRVHPGGANQAGEAVGAYEAIVALTPKSAYSWYYLRAVQSDGDVIVTSPIWVTTGAGIAVCDFACVDTVVRSGVSARVRAEIVNRNEQAICGVTALLYEATPSGRRSVSSQRVDLAGWEGTDIRFDWSPALPGEAWLELELLMPECEAPLVFPGAQVLVRKADIPRVLIDEGHNNRYTGYMDGLVALLAASDYSPRVGEEPISPEVLAKTDILVVNLPEIGFALSPTSFEQDELEAIAAFVQRGGSLLLAGWSHDPDGTRTSEQFNALLEIMQAAVRFVDDELMSDGSSTIHADWGSSEESNRPIFASEACRLAIEDSRATVDVFARAADAHVFAAGQRVGNGRIACLGAPVYSSLDLRRDSYGNSDFALAIMAWLSKGVWTAN
ncbi:MAG: hypothetical protein BWY92_00435 [Firmicutes bacterium ADurb.BinA052]|nr:MAG: hypothetical protein BWY92_00435 [Firmicutes bacterium ADurb.BinA052]